MDNGVLRIGVAKTAHIRIYRNDNIFEMCL